MAALACQSRSSNRIDAGPDDLRVDAAAVDAAVIDAAAAPDAVVDAAIDARVDAAIDARVDAAIDARVDAGPVDAAIDARVDAGPVDAAIDARVDAGPIDAPIDALTTCNLFTQTGCAIGEKCTWIVDIDGTGTAQDIGHIGCATAGTTPHGGVCVEAMAAVNGGVDTCVAGDQCVSNKCRSICDPTVGGSSGSGACPASYSCSVHLGFFEDVLGDLVAGVCEPRCDPLTQVLVVEPAPACGSADPTHPTGTCVADSGFKGFHCAPSGSVVYPNTDRRPPLTDSENGVPFGNGCAPGFMPFYVEDAASTRVLCSGMCAPAKMDSAIATAPGTPVNIKPWGDSNALGKLIADPAPVAGHSICTAAIKGSLTVANGGIEDCRYLWFPLAHGDPGNPQPSPFNDTLGFCFAYSKFLTVTVPGMSDKQPQKSCAELPVIAPVDDPYGTAVENGCYPLAESGALRAGRRGRLPGFRLANGDGLAVRHVFR